MPDALRIPVADQHAAARALIDFDAIPAAMRERRQWLLWRFELAEGDKKPRKIPYYASGVKRGGVQGGEEDRAALVDFISVKAMFNRSQRWSGIGFAFLPGSGMVGIDLDGMLNPETGEISPLAVQILAAVPTFTELSPSGRGLHLYALGETVNDKSNKIGVEVFCTSQFFTVTGKRFGGAPPEVAAISSSALDLLHGMLAEAKGDKRGKGGDDKPSAPRPPPPEVDDYRKLASALPFLDAACGYNDWLHVGMALHHALGDAGLPLWDHWSSGVANYPGRKVIDSHWKSFKPGGGITAATIYKLAMQAGWRPPLTIKKSRAATSKAPQEPLSEPAQPPPDDSPPPVADDSQHAQLDRGRGKNTRGDSARPHNDAPAQAGLGGEDVSDPKPEGGESGSKASPWKRKLLRREGRIIECRENVYIILRNHPAWVGILWADDFARKIVKRKPAPWDSSADFEEGTEWDEDETLRLGMWLAQHTNLVIKSVDTLSKAVGWVARESRYHPVRDYLDALVWDGVARSRDWLTDLLGVKKTEYTALSGRLMLIAMVARIYKPGCQMRAMPILEGVQYRGKSAALRVLGGRWYSDALLDLNNKDSYQLIQGRWIYEIAELDAFNRADSRRMKAFISIQEDRFRAPYDMAPKDYPRHSCFFGSTNQDEYFKDATGNTRYWPWRVEEEAPINLEGLAAVRDQLFAEAVHLFQAGEQWHPTQDEQMRLFEPEQVDREIGDPWETLIRRWLNNLTTNRVTTLDIITDCLKIDAGKIDSAQQMVVRVGIAMKKVGWTRKRETSGSREYYYLRPLGWDSGNQGVQGGFDVGF